MSKIVKIGVLTLGILVFSLVLVLLFTGPRMKNQPSVRSFEKEMPLSPENMVSFNHNRFDPSKVTFPGVSPENLLRGKVYYSYYCIFCHGADGKGNGEVGKSYTPKPSDLSLTNDTTFVKLYYSSFTGVGHSPVLERVVPYQHRPYILQYIREAFK